MALWNNKEDASTAATTTTAGESRKPQPAATRGGSVLGSGLRLEGRLHGTEDVRLEGRFVGEANLPKGQLTVARGGEIQADLTARIVLVEGKVVGDVHGIERVVVRQGATVEGNIAAPRVILEDGCRVTGAIDMASDTARDPSPGKQTATGSTAKPNQPVARTAGA